MELDGALVVCDTAKERFPLEDNFTGVSLPVRAAHSPLSGLRRANPRSGTACGLSGVRV